MRLGRIWSYSDSIVHVCSVAYASHESDIYGLDETSVRAAEEVENSAMQYCAGIIIIRPVLYARWCQLFVNGYMSKELYIAAISSPTSLPNSVAGNIFSRLCTSPSSES